LSSANRIEKIRDILSQKNIDALIISNEKNMYYFTEFSGGLKLLIPVDGECVLFVHAVNYEAANEIARNVRVNLIRVGEKAEAKILDEIARYQFKSIGFDRIDAREYLKIKGISGDIRVECVEDAIWSLRKIKDEREISLISRAADLTRRGMERAFEVVKPGIREYEVAAEIEYEMRRSGSSGIAFDTIVCSGPESAFPHGGLGEREIKEGDFVVIDIGAKYHGYCADMTRTVITGKPSERQKNIYETVKEAQRLAISKIMSGVRAREIDEAARKYIANKGYGEYFVHSLGHGVGLDVHEPPTIGPLSEDIISPGNVITIEPGIYIPRFGGVRLEDTILILKEKITRLTKLRFEENPIQ
jgi:Xaa-Pro aminopeptidase